MTGQDPTKKRVLILGGGFGGIYAAMRLDRSLAKDANVQITLVNRENFFLFTPMLHEVAASDLDLTHIVNPIRTLLKRVNFFEADLRAIDLANQRVTVTHGSDGHSHDLAYDFLLIAIGSKTNFFGLPGIEENAVTMKSLGDAIFLRNELIANLEEADAECAMDLREPLMTVVVAGGGFAGVETMGAINDMLTDALRFYRHIPKEALRMVLAHPGDLVLPELGPELGKYAGEKLIERKVEVRLKTKVVSATKDAVTLSDGTEIKTRMLVWTAGVSPPEVVEKLTCSKEKGRVKTNEFLEVAGLTNVWALGDCAAIPDVKTGTLYPPTAQHALRQGRVAADNITAAVRGQPERRKPFIFTTLGQLAAIGHRSGVARIFGWNFSGFVAWWLWRTIYLSKLPRFEKKVRVAIDWTLDLIFGKDLVQYLTVRAPVMSEPVATAKPEKKPEAMATPVG
jgi:NADH dehydrogenase